MWLGSLTCTYLLLIGPQFFHLVQRSRCWALDSEIEESEGEGPHWYSNLQRLDHESHVSQLHHLLKVNCSHVLTSCVGVAYRCYQRWTFTARYRDRPPPSNIERACSKSNPRELVAMPVEYRLPLCRTWVFFKICERMSALPVSPPTRLKWPNDLERNWRNYVPRLCFVACVDLW